jgi:ATP-dependent Clp protease, protease subunit
MVNKVDVQQGLITNVFADNMRPIIIVVNDFTESTLRDFEKDFSYAVNAKQPVIPIKIDSYGGEVYALQGMLELIATSDIPVATILTSKGMSCGSFLAAFGTQGYRYASPNSSMMIHDLSGGSWGKYNELVVKGDEVRRLNNGFFRRMARHCGYTDTDFFLKQIHDRGHADWYLDANEMRRLKLIDHVAYPQLVTEVKYETKLTY